MSVIGSKTKSMELEYKTIQESEDIKAIGKTDRGMEKASWFIQIKMFILVHGKMEKKKVKELMYFLKLAWSMLVFLETDKWEKVNGSIKTVHIMKGTSTTTSQKDQVHGTFKMKML